MKYFRSLKQTGDTIVEVLLALTVLSLIVGASSVLVSRSTKNLQAAQEGSVAQRLAQSQLELFRSYAPAHVATSGTLQGDEILSYDKGFCVVTPEGGVGSSALVVEKSDSTKCSVGTDGKPTTDLPYKVYLKIGGNSGGNGYKVTSTVEWQGLVVESSTVDMDYRLYDKFGANNYVEPGQDCDETPGTCPSISVSVVEVAPGGGSCSGPVGVNEAGARIDLTKVGQAGAVTEYATSGDVLFSNLSDLAQYEVKITAPSGYALCDASDTKTLFINTALGASSIINEISFKLRPLKPATAFPASHTFKSGYVSVDGATKEFEFKNTESADMTGVYTTFSSDIFKTTTSTCGTQQTPVTLEAGESCKVTVQYKGGVSSLASAGYNTDKLILNSGGSSTEVSLGITTYSHLLNKGEVMKPGQRLVAYNPACVSDVDACIDDGRAHTLDLLFETTNQLQWRKCSRVINSFGSWLYHGFNPELNMQHDGNLVIYADVSGYGRIAIWNSGTAIINYSHLTSAYAEITDSGIRVIHSGGERVKLPIVWFMPSGC